MASPVSRRRVLRGAGALVATTPFLGVVGCDERGVVTLKGATMGTRYSVVIADPPRAFDRRELKSGMESMLESVNAQMSTWRADSEISAFNTASSGSWRTVSHDMLGVVAEALRIGRLSGGAFDPTVGPLVDLWGFGPGSANNTRVPTARQIERAARRTGLGHIRANPVRSALAKGRDGIEIDLSGIAKGFGVDRMAEFLDRRDIGNYLVEIGGELRAKGEGGQGGPWRIGIERPTTAPRRAMRIVGLDGGAIATSGDYRNFFEREGARYAHIIDPRTGAPVTHALASVTVIAPTTMRADALSTALMVLGPGDGPALAEREGIAALFLIRGGDGFAEIASSAFARHRSG